MKKKPFHDPFPGKRIFNKNLLAMKLTLLLCFAGILHASAGLFSQSALISLSVHDKSVKEVLKEVETMTEYRFLYNDDFLDLDRVVSLEVTDNQVADVLDMVLESAGVSYQLLDNNLVVITPADVQQTHRITGTITDSMTGETLPGVSVVVEGTTMGTATDEEGRYSLEVANENVILQVSYVGFLQERIPVDGRIVVDVQLTPDLRFLDEVVVVGYGSMRRSDMTGSVVSISEEDLRGSISTSLDMALQGRAAGVQVTPTSGRPGGGMSISIRGASSLSGTNEPLYIVDGIPISGDGSGAAVGFDWAGGGAGQNVASPLSAINPNDIVSIEVLKDASATAIYGSRASNGVILVTTRQGRSGAPRVEYSAYTGIQQNPRKIPMLNLQEFAIYHNEFQDTHGWNRNQSFMDPSILGSGTDWQDEIFRNAWLQSHDLSVSGGFDQTTYALSFGYMSQDGVVLSSGFDRLSTRLSFNSRMYSWLEAGGSMTLGSTNETIVLNDDDRGITSLALYNRPDVPVLMPDGSWGGTLDDNDMSSLYNPVALAEMRNIDLERTRILSNLYANITLTEGLTFRSQFGSSINNNNNYAFHPTYVMGDVISDIAISRRSFANNRHWIITNFLTYDHNFGSDIRTQVMVGQEAQESRWEGMMGQRSGFINNDVQELNAGDAESALNSQYKGSNALASYFGRLNLVFLDRYLFTATYRADASSNFSPENQWGYFPSAAFAWTISNENFMQNLDAVEMLKLRVSYGQVGNQDIGGYTWGAALTNTPTRWGIGLRPNRFANPDVKWETTTATNIGVDLNLFRNRIEFIADFYLRQTKDMLWQADLPMYMGVSGSGSLSAPMVNVGEVENRGMEFTLNTVNLTGDFQWNSGLTFTLNRNKLTALYDDGNVIDRNVQWFHHATRSMVGQPIGMFYGYIADGIFTDVDDILNHFTNENGEYVGPPIDRNTGVWPGDIKFRDINGDGVIDGDDRTIIGNPHPDFTFGFNNSFSYRGFDLNIFLTGSYGNDILNFTRRETEAMMRGTNQSTRVLDRAVLALHDPEGSVDDPDNVYVSNPDTDVPRVTQTDPNNNRRMSSRYIEDGSFLKIRNVRLGYSLPSTFVSNLGLNSVRLYVNLQNLYTFTNYSGFDPQIGAYNQDVLLTGVDNGFYPSPRMYTFGLNVGF